MPTAPGRVALGHADADATLQGGLAVGAVHEVFADAGPAKCRRPTGFCRGALRGGRRHGGRWFGVRQDFTEIESGALSMSGLAELGSRSAPPGDGARGPDVDTAFANTPPTRSPCDALGAVVLEVWGRKREQLDLVASRKLTLAAQAVGASTGLFAAGGAAEATSPPQRRRRDGSCAAGAFRRRQHL